jgi:hypothetical protein
MPAPPYRNRRREFTPSVGEKVLVTGQVGMFSVEEVDADKKTAVLRNMRSHLLVKGVEWVTMFPWEFFREGLPVGIKKSIEEESL